MPSNVIIVGGSLGGICAGLVLKGLGHNVRILERNPTPLLHNQGAGIVAGGYVQELFDRYDSTHRQIAVTSRMRHYLSRQGGAVSEEHRAQTMTSWDLLYHVLRANFVGLQSGYTETRGTAEGEGSATYEYGCLVDKVEYEAGKVKLGFKNREGHQDSTSADLVIAADGPSSSVRRILLPQIQRRYAGYVAWRGTVPETEVSAESKQTFVEKFAFYTETGIQIFYTIPGEKGSLTPGHRLLNWVWYCNYPEDSTAYAELMTDNQGTRHHTTLPVGGVRDDVWLRQREYAREVLPHQFAELVNSTRCPFVQSITDVLSPQALFFDQKLLLIGDALAGFRPHTAASTNQAALHALLLEQVMKGEMAWAEYEENVLDFARTVSAQGIAMGNRIQFGR